MKLREEEISKISSSVLSQVFLSLKDEVSVAEVLVGATYAIEKFKLALLKLDAVPIDGWIEMIEREAKEGAAQDISQELLEKVKLLTTREE